MTVDMIVPARMHEQVTAEQYAAWTEARCAAIEIVDGMVCVGPRPSKRHNRPARLLANALDDAPPSRSTSGSDGSTRRRRSQR